MNSASTKSIGSYFTSKRIALLLATSVVALSVASSSVAYANWDWKHPLDPVNKAIEHIAPAPAKAIEKAVDQTKNAAVAPAAAAVDILKGKPAVQAIQTSVQTQGQAISADANAAAAVHNGVAGVIVRGAGAVAGDGGETVATELLRPDSIIVNESAAGISGVGEVIAHGDGSYLVSAPLAGALRDAHAKYDSLAKPIPTDVKAYLSKVHSAETLARARYVIAGVPDDLGAIIDRGNVASGRASGYAVVVDDIIVFSAAPGTTPSDLWWWAHEVTHTVQYQRLGGIDEFANAYTKNGPALEREADAKGDEMLRILVARN